MQDTSTDTGATPSPQDDGSVQHPDAEPQRRQRERSGMLGEPAGIPPGSEGGSDGSEREDPIHEQVPQHGDHWRR